MLHVIRTIIFTLSLYIGTHLFVFTVLPVAILISYVNKASIPALKRWFTGSVFAIVGKKVRITGRENVNPEGAYVIIANYPSGYAGFALVGAFPHASLVAHAYLKNIPLLGQILRRLGTIFVRPGTAGRGRRALDLHLSENTTRGSVIVLPEGGRTPDGKIHRFRRGFLYFLRHSALDLLPVTLNGFYQLKPAGRLYLDPRAQPEMIIHPPVGGAAIRRMGEAGLLATARETIVSDYRP
jgi:1-acyl-sn-glycerol-3-phosphate acyltransferase